MEDEGNLKIVQQSCFKPKRNQKSRKSPKSPICFQPNDLCFAFLRQTVAVLKFPALKERLVELDELRERRRPEIEDGRRTKREEKGGEKRGKKKENKERKERGKDRDAERIMDVFAITGVIDLV